MKRFVRILTYLCAFGIAIAGYAHARTPTSPAQSKATVNIFGSVTNNQGTPLCALVLANGQFMFSCSPTGQYSLDVPLDASGQVTLFGFADGHFPYKQVFGGSGGRYDMTLNVATTAPANDNLSRTQKLIGGTWYFSYRIISTFTDTFSFTTVSSTPDSNGDYYAFGTDQFGRTSAGAYYSKAGFWDVLVEGTIIDQFYTFTFSDNNHISGCYYQISPPGSTNTGACYALSGYRSPPKSVPFKSAFELLEYEAALLREAAADGSTGLVDQNVVEAYRSARAAGTNSR